MSIDDIVLDGSYHSIRTTEHVVDEFTYGIKRAHIAKTAIYPGVIEDDYAGKTAVGFNWTSTNYYHWMTQSLPSIFTAVEKYGAVPELERCGIMEHPPQAVEAIAA